jgi:hypothetical protein
MTMGIIVFLSNIFHLFYVAHSLKESYQADLRGQPHQSKRFLSEPSQNTTLLCAAYFLSLSLMLFWNYVMTILWIGKIQSNWHFLFGKNPKHLNLFFCSESRISLSKRVFILYVLVHHLCGLKLFAVYDFVFYFE